MVLRKKEIYTVITPIPHFIPRQLALDILHSHSEVITLNPLVIDHKPIPPPRNAAADEYYSTWYEITQRIQWVPGMGKMGSGKITFTGCFHDLPWGLQTHTYAAANVELRNKYRVAGNQPGVEPTEHREMGLEALGAPTEGLYLREDIEIRCNIAMVSFVKSQLKAASKEMISRIIKKAELLDAGVLKSMMQDGKLKTINPLDRSASTAAANRQSVMSQGQYSAPPMSPSQQSQYPASPAPSQFAQPASPQPVSANTTTFGTAPPLPPKEYEYRPMELPADQTPAHGNYNPYQYQRPPPQGVVELNGQAGQQFAAVELGTGEENQRY